MISFIIGVVSFAVTVVPVLANTGLLAQPGLSACAKLTSSLGSGKVQPPNSTAYIESQQDYWNSRQLSYNPSCVVYPTCAADVSAILRAVKAAKSRFAIKAGGHNPNTFFSSVDSGVLIDLNNMTARSYNNVTTIGTYEPGGVFGDLYTYFQQFNRTVVGARLAGVGTGLALGGGLSYLSPQYGMACDSFRELEIVLPNGTIVTASPKHHADLFFAARGGGGNAFGVVTKYTVQSRPAGMFYAGNIIYTSQYTSVALEAIRNFIRYNIDPKATIIGTIESTPGTENVILFLVYDGVDSGSAFSNFTSITSMTNTLSLKNYLEVVNLPVPNTAKLTRGNNTFRVQVHRIQGKSYKQAYTAWRDWYTKNNHSYALTSLDYQPVPKSLTDASKAQTGGNAMQMPDGPWFWINYLLETPAGLSDKEYKRVQASFKSMVESVPNAAGLPLFINDASYDQDPLATFSSYCRLKDIKHRYDPDKFFTNYTGGWSFSSPCKR